MFEWIRSFFSSAPVCPVNEEEREWLEERFEWLIEEFGIDRLRTATTVVPTTEFFPSRWHGTEDEIHGILLVVAEQMDVDPDYVRVKFYSEGPSPVEGMAREGSLGTYSESEDWGFYDIRINTDALDDPLGIVSTMAHELGHVRLLGEERIWAEAPDNEPLTDLTTVFFGLGILRANSVVRQKSVGSGTSLSRSGYLSMNMLGYALGLYALARDETNPTWLKHLRADVRWACRNTIRLKLQNESNLETF